MTATSLWLRVYDLENLPGINGDEAWYGVQAFAISTGRPFAAWTPTGLPLNPFLTGIEVPLLLVFRPSFWILRAPAVASGVLAVFLVFWLGSRILDRTTALIAALLLAILPTAIGYSRFGWDASQTPLFSVPALYFAFRGKTLAMLISFAFCLIVHLSNLFLLPILLAPFFVALWSADREPRKRRLILGMIAVLGLIAFLTLVVIDWRLDHALLAFSAVPGNWLCFLGHYGRLISGVTFYEYVVGPVAQRTQDRYDGAFWGLFLALVGLGVPHLVRSRRWDRLALIAGLVLGALALYLAAGPEIIGPHHERYGMYLIVPTILVTACLISALLPDSEGAGCRIARQLAFAVMLVGAWVWLFFFNVHYFDALRATGGESHRTFRTAEVEPKQQAVRLILADIALRNPATGRRADNAPSHRNPDTQVGRGDGSTQPVIAEDRWLYWPLRFLASRHRGIALVSFDNDQPWPGPATGARKAALVTTLASGGYAVVYAGGAFEQLVASTFPPNRLRRWDIQDYRRKKLITVFRVQSR